MDQRTAEVEHKMAMDAVGFAARLLIPQREPLSRLVEAERSMHSSLHITDPTLYRRAISDDGLRQQVELARAALAFVGAVQSVMNELGSGDDD